MVITATHATNAGSAARGSSFHLPMLLLPRRKRQDLLNVYALCRALDDAVDDAPDTETAIRHLDTWERELDAIFSGGTPSHPVAIAFQATHRKLGFHREDAYTMLAAMRMDAAGAMYYPSLDELERYCYGAASCAGLMALKVFGCAGETAERFAIHLGHALQLTNIGRDVLVDARADRVYLAAEWVGERRPSVQEILNDPAALTPSYRKLAETAADHYRLAGIHAAGLPARDIAPALAMRDVYLHYWRILRSRDHQPPASGRLSIGMGKKCALAARATAYLAGINVRSAG